jgi:hypothetical protein
MARPEERVPAELPTITFAADGCVMGYWRDLSLAVWATQATMPLVNELTKLADMLEAKYGLTSTVHLIVDNAPVPGNEARTALDALTKRYQEKLQCVVTMVEATGFMASAMRSFLTGLHVLARRAYKNKVAADVHEAATWLAANHRPHLADALDADEVEAVMQWMLAQARMRG